MSYRSNTTPANLLAPLLGPSHHSSLPPLSHSSLPSQLSINEVKEGVAVQEQRVKMISLDLFQHAKSGNDQQCKRLIVSGADPHCLDSHGRNLLHVAAQGGHMRTIELFTSCNVDINKVRTYADI